MTRQVSASGKPYTRVAEVGPILSCSLDFELPTEKLPKNQRMRSNFTTFFTASFGIRPRPTPITDTRSQCKDCTTLALWTKLFLHCTLLLSMGTHVLPPTKGKYSQSLKTAGPEPWTSDRTLLVRLRLIILKARGLIL